MTRRLGVFLLAMMVVFSSWPAVLTEGAPEAAATESTGFEGEYAYDASLRFGANAVVESDEDGFPVSVNGYPWRLVETCFNVRAVEDKFVSMTDFVDYPFWMPATEYDGNLAVMSLFMSLCAARDLPRNEDPATFDPSQNVEGYLLDAGFTDIRKDDYSKETSLYTISTAIGSRRMEHEGEEPFTLIAVGVCGGGYKNEWQSNLTAGEGELHEGFRSASDLLIDRIAGYIATRGISGRIKIWLSGFSRAAAVANLTAGRLTKAGLFRKEDIYAYTYATPAAVLNPPETGYENIYNIICPTDAVPQVMPAEWGYGRYGKDLFLPVPEFTSLGESFVLEREAIIKAAFGIDIHYSAPLNLRMRLLISMLYEAIGSRENYVASIQDTAVKILQQKNASNVLSTMRRMLQSVAGSGRETRVKLDSLINYLVRVFGNAVTRTELAEGNRNSGSSLFLLFTEHREDSYLASMNTIRSGSFEEDTDFTYVMVKGPVDLELTLDEVPGWSMVLEKQGTVLVRKEDGAETVKDPEYKPFYMERLGNVSIAAVPRDMMVRLQWKAVSGGTVEVRHAVCGLRVTHDYPGASSGEIRVSAGDTGTAWIPDLPEGTVPEGFREATYFAGNLTEFLGISKPIVSWRFLVTETLLVIGLVFFLVVRLAYFLFPHKQKKGALGWCLLALFFVAATEAEGAYWMLTDMTFVRCAWKAVAGAAVLGVYFLRREGNQKGRGSVLPGLLAAIAADLVITWTFLPGAALFLLCHILLILCFLKNRPIIRSQWAQWVVLSVLVVGLVIFVFVPRLGTSAWVAAVYAPVLFLMFYSASGQSPRLRNAAGFFLVSDLLLGVYFAVWNDPLVHFLYMALFSVSLMLLASGDQR